ncbi:nuclear transport factor 2 family protein [Parasphingopyxis lamellibrachiae]|uniref:SnoaL-like protein n=1 Tax=Parasphingopyxis lamellibrachiae TaxID=680125 RepID=A0A3D9FI73_9SPHN|nr:nuclear transport factor 2 family protein [Parasphingopyxis lamellibrachiae]RED16786.1 SnoaL-like protein [Parasphingopyxis lamellibrachiae]
MSVLHDRISAYLDAYFEAWNAYDVPAMRALWDESEDNPVYLAEECAPHHGWDAILAYWGVDRSQSERLLTWRDLSVTHASTDVAIAFFHANWSTYIPGNRLYPRPFGGPVRITMVLRKKAEGWRAIHYAEAPLASIIQLREAHEAAVDPALHERLAAKGIRY